MNTLQGILPNLIIIGAMKAGTTSLHHYLKLHPQISMSQEKELDFFIEEKNWHRGIEWYQSQFSGQAQIYGEASPNYTNYPWWKGIPQRMYSVVPDAKLVYILRDPIKRIISHYIHQYDCGKENRTFAQALEDFQDNTYLNLSRYSLQLEQYLNYFPRSNILIITTEELDNSPDKTLQTIFDFLNIEHYSLSSAISKKLHKSEFKRRKTDLGVRLSETQLLKAVGRLPPQIRYKAQKIIYFPFSKKIDTPTVTSELRQRIIDYLREDINILKQYTGLDFKEWCV